MGQLNVLLLVEDDDNDIIITKRKIARANILINELIITKTVQETRETIKHKEIDLILLDLNLPDSSGLDTLDAVREIYSGIIIVLTSIDDESIGIEAIRKGADEYLVKGGLTEKTLSTAIFHAIARKTRWTTVNRIHDIVGQIDTVLKK